MIFKFLQLVRKHCSDILDWLKNLMTFLFGKLLSLVPLFKLETMGNPHNVFSSFKADDSVLLVLLVFIGSLHLYVEI